MYCSGLGPSRKSAVLWVFCGSLSPETISRLGRHTRHVTRRPDRVKRGFPAARHARIDLSARFTIQIVFGVGDSRVHRSHTAATHAGRLLLASFSQFATALLTYGAPSDRSGSSNGSPSCGVDFNSAQCMPQTLRGRVTSTANRRPPAFPSQTQSRRSVNAERVSPTMYGRRAIQAHSRTDMFRSKAKPRTASRRIERSSPCVAAIT